MRVGGVCPKKVKLSPGCSLVAGSVLSTHRVLGLSPACVYTQRLSLEGNGEPQKRCELEGDIVNCILASGRVKYILT